MKKNGSEQCKTAIKRCKTAINKIERPVIFSYLDYRKYLADIFAYSKAMNPNFSHRYLANKAVASSSSWFSSIVAGNYNLTPAYRIKLGNIFKLKGREKDYFEVIVNFCHASTGEEKELLLKRIIDFSCYHPTLISKDKFEYFSKWYIPVIRELLFIHDFSDDYDSLARQLNPTINISEAKHAIQTLLSIGFVQRNSDGNIRPCDPVVEKDRCAHSIYWSLYMKTVLNLAVGALEKFARKERDISALTLILSEESLKMAREKIDELRTSLVKLSENDKKRTTVYQCSIQIFPITHPKKDV
jgi:uncharacterized protein (TIGR02147 family)